MPVAVGYVRVSARGQEKGQSLPGQRKEIEEFCQFRRFGLLDVYQDVESAESADRRRGFQQALLDLYEGRANVLVVYKLDRFARSVLDGVRILQEFRQRELQLVCIADPIDTTSPWGEAMYQMMLVFAELERKQTRERCVEGKERKRENDGYVHGRPPYGYLSIGKMLVPCPVEQAAIAKIMELHECGWGARRIVAYLNEHLSIYPRKKKTTKWSNSMVQGIINDNSPLRLWAGQKHGLIGTAS